MSGCVRLVTAHVVSGHCYSTAPESRTVFPIGVERDVQRVDARGVALALDKDAVAVGGLPDAVEDAEGSKFAQRLAQR
jgi:hypothetical protein